MVLTRVSLKACLVAGLLGFIQPASADYYTLIVQGNVVMPDGTPPPKTVGIERVCSDVQASAPGPLADKKGHYTWKMDLDPREHPRVLPAGDAAGIHLHPSQPRQDKSQ